MHSPIEDILAYLLLKDKIDLDSEISSLAPEEKERYKKNIDLLISTGLIRKNEHLVIPDNALIEIERSPGNISSKMKKALSYFFSRGYDNISSIQQVLGPYLTISGFIYGKCIEYDEVIPVEFHEIQTAIQQNYGQLIKQMKIPRYLIQLNEVGLIDQNVIGGDDVWLPKPEILRELKLEDTILDPVRTMFIDSEVRPYPVILFSMPPPAPDLQPTTDQVS